MTRVILGVRRVAMLLQVKLEPRLGFEHVGLRFPAQHVMQLKPRGDTCQSLTFAGNVVVQWERTGK